MVIQRNYMEKSRREAIEETPQRQAFVNSILRRTFENKGTILPPNYSFQKQTSDNFNDSQWSPLEKTLLWVDMGLACVGVYFLFAYLSK